MNNLTELWYAIGSSPENELIETKISDDSGERNHQKLIKKGNLWFVPDESMYVYYTPTHWRHLQ